MQARDARFESKLYYVRQVRRAQGSEMKRDRRPRSPWRTLDFAANRP